MYNVLKQRQQWKRNMLPDLVENLRGLMTSQYAEADRAICGRGNFTLYVPVIRNIASPLLTGSRCQSRSGSGSGTLSSRCQMQALLERISQLLVFYWCQPDRPAPSRCWQLLLRWHVFWENSKKGLFTLNRKRQKSAKFWQFASYY